MDQSKLLEFLWKILGEAIDPRPAEETWEAMITRIRSGRLCRIDRDTFTHFREMLPPRYVGSLFFAFAEGTEPIKLFIRRHNRFLARQLTQEETQAFCALAESPLPNAEEKS